MTAHVDFRDFRERYGPWALVAGGSLGLGAEFARQLAAAGLNLILVAERQGPLEQTAAALGAAFPDVQIRSVAADLGDRDVLQALRAEARDVEVGLLVYNAAHAPIGRFLDQDVADKLKILDVNCRGPVLLVDEFARPMLERGRGGVLLMSSLSAFHGTPLVATYAASKAFDLVLGEALWEELRRDGVDVLAFCAGSIRTPNYEKTRPRKSGRFSPPVMEVEPVVREALATLGCRPSAVAGRANRLATLFMTRLLPRRRAIETLGRVMRATYGKRAD